MIAISPNITKETSISQALIVSVEECGEWLNLSPSAITMQNDMLEGLIKTVTEIVESYTWLSLRQKTFEAYYDLQENVFYGFFDGNIKLGLQRAPIIDITNITKLEYLSGDQWVEFNRGTMTIDGLYENTTEKAERRQWASIKFKESVPFQERCNAYKIRVTFTAGYNPTETNIAKKIPEVIKLAIKNIVSYHYTNRGDCESACNLNGFPVPCVAKGMLDQISVKNSTLGADYTPAGECYGCTD
jgi:hypothetical protein